MSTQKCKYFYIGHCKKNDLFRLLFLFIARQNCFTVSIISHNHVEKILLKLNQQIQFNEVLMTLVDHNGENQLKIMNMSYVKKYILYIFIF